MEFACPVCKAKYDVPDNRIKPPGANLTCRRCTTKIAIRIKDGKAVIGRAVAQAQPPTGASAKEQVQTQREEPSPEGETIPEKIIEHDEEEWEEPAEEPKKGGGSFATPAFRFYFLGGHEGIGDTRRLDEFNRLCVSET